MITVVGEALVDLVIEPSGAVEAKLGGAPFNTARACGRLGADVRFVGAVSSDRFGSMLAAQLEADGVDISALVRVDEPTTLAAAELDEAGAAVYRFYIEGTSAPRLIGDLDGSGADAVFTGGLGLLLEPMASTVESIIESAPSGQLVMVDVNCRPLIVPEREPYVGRVERVVARSHIVKVSDEDLDYLAPDLDPINAARRVLAMGPRAVLVTAGRDGVHVLTADGARTVPVAAVDVVDTIGAGDSFDAGFLTWWMDAGFGSDDASDLDRVADAVGAAVAVAGVVVTRRGADPPWRTELPDDWSR